MIPQSLRHPIGIPPLVVLIGITVLVVVSLPTVATPAMVGAGFLLALVLGASKTTTA